MLTESAHVDQLSQEAARRLIPPTPRFCSIAPSVTTPLYSTDVSQALREALLGRYCLGRGEPNFQTSTYKKDEQCMLVSMKQKADFSLGVWVRESGQRPQCHV